MLIPTCVVELACASKVLGMGTGFELDSYSKTVPVTANSEEEYSCPLKWEVG